MLFVRDLPLDLTAMGDPTRSVTPDGITLRISGPHKLLHHDKVTIHGEEFSYEIQHGNRPFGPPRPYRPAIAQYNNIVLHTRANLQL